MKDLVLIIRLYFFIKNFLFIFRTYNFLKLELEFDVIIPYNKIIVHDLDCVV